jgi:hypothetical protein
MQAQPSAQSSQLAGRVKLLVNVSSDDTISCRTKTATNDKTLSVLFDTTITDIFNKFDARNKQVL